MAQWYILAENCVRDAIAKGLDRPEIELLRITMRPGRAHAPAVSASLAFTELVSEIAERLYRTRETELEMRVAVRDTQRQVLARMTFRVLVRARRAPSLT